MLQDNEIHKLKKSSSDLLQALNDASTTLSVTQRQAQDTVAQVSQSRLAAVRNAFDALLADLVQQLRELEDMYFPSEGESGLSSDRAQPASTKFWLALEKLDALVLQDHLGFSAVFELPLQTGEYEQALVQASLFTDRLQKVVHGFGMDSGSGTARAALKDLIEIARLFLGDMQERMLEGLSPEQKVSSCWMIDLTKYALGLNYPR